jgi:hypothetical protein
MSSGGQSQTVGYRYYMGLHLVWCLGPIDAVRKIVAGDRLAWTGNQAGSGQIQIDAPELFGGDEKEGGLQGAVDVMMGEPAQGVNAYLAAKLGAPISAFRGVVSTVFRQGLISANNPYIKAQGALLRRILMGWEGGTAWYSAKAGVDLGAVFVVLPGRAALVAAAVCDHEDQGLAPAFGAGSHHLDQNFLFRPVAGYSRYKSPV